jgi:DNA-binding transcriptional LysR family regulator
MDRLKAIESFVFAARSNSFSGAARHLRVSRAMVSRRISELENHVGVRLFHRTTRELSLTSAGRQYFEFCSQTLQALEHQDETLSDMQQEPKGLLRIVAARPFGIHHLGAAVADFQKSYPELRIEMELTSGNLVTTQLIQFGFDLGIGLAPAPKSRIVARRIADFGFILCAAPDYLKTRGVPGSLHQLAQHACLINPRHNPTGTWEFSRHGKRLKQKIPATLSITNIRALRDAALHGAGIALLPSYCVNNDLREGRLIRVLERYSMTRGTIFALYPHFRMIPAKVKVFTDFARRRFDGKLG